MALNSWDLCLMHSRSGTVSTSHHPKRCGSCLWLRPVILALETLSRDRCKVHTSVSTSQVRWTEAQSKVDLPVHKKAGKEGEVGLGHYTVSPSFLLPWVPNLPPRSLLSVCYTCSCPLLFLSEHACTGTHILLLWNISRSTCMGCLEICSFSR